jgi:hypothetical protein
MPDFRPDRMKSEGIGGAETRGLAPATTPRVLVAATSAFEDLVSASPRT